MRSPPARILTILLLLIVIGPLAAVDLGDPWLNEPRIRPFLALADDGQYLYVLDDRRLMTYELGESDPVLRSVQSVGGSGRGLDCRKGLLAVALGHAVQFYSLDEPERPLKRSTFPVPSGPTGPGIGEDVALGDGWAYVPVYEGLNGLLPVDLSDISRPQLMPGALVSFRRLNQPQNRVIYHKGNVITGGSAASILIFNAQTDPGRPQLTARHGNGGTFLAALDLAIGTNDRLIINAPQTVELGGSYLTRAFDLQKPLQPESLFLLTYSGIPSRGSRQFGSFIIGSDYREGYYYFLLKPLPASYLGDEPKDAPDALRVMRDDLRVRQFDNIAGYDILLRGDRGYVAQADRLVVLDTSDTWQPRPIGEVSYGKLANELLFSQPSLTVPEGDAAETGLRLSQQPSGTIVAQLTLRPDGDPDFSITSATTVTFDAGNWDQPQQIRIALGQDEDAVNGTAIMQAQADGLDTAELRVSELDDESSLVLSRSPEVTIPEGGSANMTFQLGSPPDSDVEVTCRRISGDSDVTISFGEAYTVTPANWSSPKPLLFLAAEDADTVDGQAIFELAGGDMDPIRLVFTERDNDGPAGSLIIEPLEISISEGGQGSVAASFGDSLEEDVTLTIERIDGDPDITLANTDPVVIDSFRSRIPMPIVFSVASDEDVQNDSAVFRISYPGGSVDVTVHEIEQGMEPVGGRKITIDMLPDNGQEAILNESRRAPLPASFDQLPASLRHRITFGSPEADM